MISAKNDLDIQLYEKNACPGKPTEGNAIIAYSDSPGCKQGI